MPKPTIEKRIADARKMMNWAHEALKAAEVEATRSEKVLRDLVNEQNAAMPLSIQEKCEAEEKHYAAALAKQERGKFPKCYRCEKPIRDREFSSSHEGVRHLNSCPA